jgi:two-component system, NarL family, response regulator DesR
MSLSLERGVRVVVVDDSVTFRAAAAEVVRASPGFVVAALLASGEDAVRWLQRSPADLVLMDVQMPGIGGVAAALAIARMPRQPVVVFLSADDWPEISADPRQYGAVAFKAKDCFSPRMLRGLWTLHAGAQPVAP